MMTYKKKGCKKRGRGFNKDLILEVLAELGETTVENLLNLCLNIPEVFFRKYSLSSMSDPLKQYVRVDFATKIKFYNLVSSLKKQGLVAKQSNEVKITRSGRSYRDKTPSWNVRYKPVGKLPTGKVMLVMFDIPETMRNLRDWLRLQLKEMGCNFLQNSVWYGIRPLPAEFIQDLKKHKILPYVHILNVDQKGTLSKWFEQIGRPELS